MGKTYTHRRDIEQPRFSREDKKRIERANKESRARNKESSRKYFAGVVTGAFDFQ
jgi:hypothetical protein